MPITLPHLKAEATCHAEQARKVSSTLTLDLIEAEDDLPDTRAERDDAQLHVEKLEAIATVAGMVEALPDALSGEALAALQGMVLQAEAFLARESMRATLARAVEFERDLPY